MIKKGEYEQNLDNKSLYLFAVINPKFSSHKIIPTVQLLQYLLKRSIVDNAFSLWKYGGIKSTQNFVGSVKLILGAYNMESIVIVFHKTEHSI